MFDQFLRNRLSIQCTTAGTGWLLIGANGTGYASNVLALAGSTYPAPGPPSSFPTGAPRMIIQAVTSSGDPVAGDLQVATNTLIAPTTPDFVVPEGEPGVIDSAGTTSVWVKKETSGSYVNVTFQY